MNVLRNSVSRVGKRLFELSALCADFRVACASHIVCKSSYVTSIACEPTAISELNLEKMTDEISKSTVLDPPASVRGMKILDRDAFSKEVTVPCFITPVEKIKFTIKILKPFLLKLRNFEPVQENDGKKIIYLNPAVTEDEIATVERLLRSEGIDGVSFKTVKLTYDNWYYEDIFKAIFLPEMSEGVSGFSVIGHILHLNLKPHADEYKKIIGQVFLDKKTNIKTVVNKVTAIDNTFRNFEMEILAGEPDFIVTVKEFGCRYALDFSQVFWNPRLCTEHSRIANKLKHGDVVFDVFAGVGPFTIPAAKKGCYVYANDLNPHSFKWLCHNAKLNKVDSCIKTYNLDGRNFIITIIKDKLKDLWVDKKTFPSIHIIMNLPAFSFEFLDAYKNILSCFDDTVRQEIKLPIVHCYFFTEKESSPDDSKTEIEKIFECEIEQHILEIAHVRTVAPAKNMMRISFTIPEKVLFCNSIDVAHDPPSKKIKL